MGGIIILRESSPVFIKPELPYPDCGSNRSSTALTVRSLVGYVVLPTVPCDSVQGPIAKGVKTAQFVIFL